SGSSPQVLFSENDTRQIPCLWTRDGSILFYKNPGFGHPFWQMALSYSASQPLTDRHDLCTSLICCIRTGFRCRQPKMLSPFVLGMVERSTWTNALRSWI